MWLIEGRTANEVWKKATDILLKQETTLKGRNGDVYELLHAFVSVENPKQKWVYDRIPPMSIGFALAELVWIMNGKEQSEVINYWNPSLPKFAGAGDIYYGAYGKRIRSHFGFDQLERAYHVLQNAPESRQVVIQIYDVEKDFPMENGQPRSTDVPCNVCSLLKIRNGKLEWSQIMRSNDILLGMPYNFVQFTSLQEILAGWLGLEVGSYIHYSDSLHLYNYDANKIGVGQEREIENLDSLSLCKEESERIFREIYERMISLKDASISEQEIFSLGQLGAEYTAYNNIMLMIAAYVARKHHYSDMVEELVHRCRNEAYTYMWNRWTNKSVEQDR
ncbi:MAG: thymidylate synthase [Lachnospiraceae bacterium]|nr:thymidylate synthase [Lachnospiraceae bacterium]